MDQWNLLLDWVGLNLWGLTLLSFHVMFTWGVSALFCTAPDALQKTALFFLLLALLALVLYYTIALFIEPAPEIEALAYKIQHVAVLIGVARLLWLEKLSCKNYSAPSPSSAA